MPWDGSRYRISGPDEARLLGLEHGRQGGGPIDQHAIQQCWPGWTADEVNAYLEGRCKGAKEGLR